jgi:hypothetical protein
MQVVLQETFASVMNVSPEVGRTTCSDVTEFHRMLQRSKAESQSLSMTKRKMEL